MTPEAGTSTLPDHASHSAATQVKPLTVVLKLGTSSVLNLDTLTPRLSLLSSIVETCHALRLAGHRVVIVCSGAIGIGRMRMNVRAKPDTLGERQALAALGQLRLMALWDNLFNQVGISVAQVLLTRNDIADRPRYLNAKTTLHTLLHTYQSIPIVNENDTVSVSELRFGDNDTLSAITAGLVDADYLFLCTDVDGLYTGNPRSNPNARRLGVVRSVQEARKAVSVDTPGSSFGTGGMQTKLIAAELATAAGVATVIISSDHPPDMLSVVARGIPPTSKHTSAAPQRTKSNEPAADLASSISSLTSEESSLIGYPPLANPAHTLFLPQSTPLPSRKWSVLHALHPTGAIIIDEGAYKRISKQESGGRLLPAGVVETRGHWERMQAVRLMVRRKAADVEDTKSSADAAEGKGESLMDRIKENLGVAADAAPTASDSKGSGLATPPLVEALHTTTSPPSSVPSTAQQTRPPPPPPPLSRSTTTSASASASVAEESWHIVEVGRCLANYTSEEVSKMKGLRSSEIERVLGFADSEYVTDTVVMLERGEAVGTKA
ncbi:glutamate 5-kinase [Microstroma glucosiphilum]|uniref:Glutamate 5-kinase n=1 Tax=Pseudomicrostroma glucosiphilum TaxID=1684307 RepID=A0A316U965_9BASI|nr:glutamate 5-kinase [Pseudomicrostroma glucosiphilum]PWN21394.1 glutamate 5-kinase [Pseudomicrostroma glucosiphilum]